MVYTTTSLQLEHGLPPGRLALPCGHVALVALQEGGDSDADFFLESATLSGRGAI